MVSTLQAAPGGGAIDLAALTPMKRFDPHRRIPVSEGGSASEGEECVYR